MLNQLLQGRYQVIRELGKGAFGQTYIAQDTQYPGKPYCVVKHLQPDDPRSLEKAKQLFLREAEILAKLGKHNQIPELKAYSETQFYLVQEFIDGHPLRDEIPPARSWIENDVVSLLQDILPVLVFIHEQGVIHRDIKPDNIMRRQRDNKLVLIDFGAIKEKVLKTPGTGGSTVAGSRVYTLGYAPPEQTSGKPQFNSDIYALGMTVIEALTGKYPHLLQEDDNTGEIIWQNKASVSPGLAAIITKMIRYRRQDRYQSAGEVLQALQQLIQASQAQATSSSGVVNQLTLEWQEAGQIRNTTIREQQPSKNPGTIRIGRDPAQCDIVFSDLTVSGLHVEIFFNQQQKRFYVRNLRQTNPPIVDGRSLSTGEVSLSQGSNLQLGQINLRVTNITLGQARSVAPTKLGTATKPTEVTTSYQSSASTPVAPTENPAAGVNNDPNDYIERGKQLIEQKEYQQAIQVLDLALRLSPNDARVYKYRGRARYELPDLSQAIEDFNLALRLNPSDAELYMYRGECRVLVDTEGAITDCTLAIQLDPHLISAYYSLILCYELEDDYQKALQTYTKAIRNNPNNAGLYFSYAKQLHKLKDYQGAINNYSLSINIDANNAEFYSKRGDVYLELQEYQQAIADYNKALQIDANHFHAYHDYNSRGVALSELGNYEGAIADFEKALQLCSDNNLLRILDTQDTVKDTTLFNLENTRAKLAEITNPQPQNWRCLNTLNAHSSSFGQGVSSIAFSLAGQFLASGGVIDNKVKVFNLQNLNQVITFSGHKAGVRTVSVVSTFNETGDEEEIVVFSGSDDKTINAWDVKSKEKQYSDSDFHSKAVTSIAYSPNYQYVASGSDDRIINLVDMEGERSKSFYGHNSYIQSLAFSLDNQYLASGGCDKEARIWKLEEVFNSTGNIPYTHFTGHNDHVTCVQFSPKNEIFATSGRDGKIMLWNYKTGQSIYDIAAHSSGTLYGVAVAFSPDGKILASGGPDNLIKIWHVKTGKQLATLSGHSNAVTSVAFSPDGKILASGSGDGTIKLWQRQ